jgi:hypothetical protein
MLCELFENRQIVYYNRDLSKTSKVVLSCQYKFKQTYVGNKVGSQLILYSFNKDLHNIYSIRSTTNGGEPQNV